MIIGIDGGMITARVAEEEVTAAAKDRLYPFFFIAGIKIDPRAATSATAEPLISAKKRDALIVTIDRPPRMNPTRADARAIKRRLIPVAFMIAPAKIKSGIAMSGNDVAPENITSPAFGREATPLGPVIIATTATIPSEMAMGTPMSTSTNKTAPIAIKLILRLPPAQT
jgi:hypothetical protein